jgi:NAD(P)-dependent dehydrogenase (short-subunit alcohol dehydrogenase family)
MRLSAPATLDNKVLLVTGATGIAAATAALAMRSGAHVVVTGLTQESLESLRADLPGLEVVAGDLVQPATADAAITRCRDRYGRLDAVFNVAGISGRRFGDGPLHECTDEGWDVTMATNLRSMFLVCRASLRQMLGQAPSATGGRGAILNMSSVLAIAPEPRHFATHAYAASKGAVIALTRALAAYYAPHGIRVNAIAPGLVRTPMSARAQADPAIVESMQVRQPLAGGFIEPDEIARAAVFLLSDDARVITGETLVADAGWSSGMKNGE